MSAKTDKALRAVREALNGLTPEEALSTLETAYRLINSAEMPPTRPLSKVALRDTEKPDRTSSLTRRKLGH